MQGLQCRPDYSGRGKLLPCLFTLASMTPDISERIGGLFSVALSVSLLLSLLPSCYEVHCSPEFGLSSPYIDAAARPPIKYQFVKNTIKINYLFKINNYFDKYVFKNKKSNEILQNGISYWFSFYQPWD
jgi:hypothetical protein